MALFSKFRFSNGQRLTGMARFTELLDRDFKRFFSGNLLTLAGFLPFGIGVLFSILSSSILVLLPSCVIGGAIAGPALSCMYDLIYRSLRDAPGRFFENYRHAWKQNRKQSVVPGIVFCLLIGCYLFMAMMFWWATTSPGYGTIAVYIVGLVILTMIFSLYWPQIVLFEQTGVQRFRNCILFIIRFFPKTFGCALLQIIYWVILALFLPWSVVLLLLTGFWFILFLANFLLYNTMNETFHIEEEIAKSYPEQAAFYEDDQTWLKRKQEEENGTKH